MKLFLQIFFTLVIFLKTGNLLSENNLFNVDNILIKKKDGDTSEQLANKAIKKGFDQLINRLLLNEDQSKVSNIDYSSIKQLIQYYNIVKNLDNQKNLVNYSVTFDKDKIHNLFYKENISYSDILDKEFYILPIIIEKNDIFIFSNNYFYDNWNKTEDIKLIEFIPLLENIEIIQKINQSRNNLLDLKLELIFQEYFDKNLALILIENFNTEEKIYLKAKIQDKIIVKRFSFQKKDSDKEKFYEKIIINLKEDITNLVKSQNLIDIRTPSFLNVILNLKNDFNLVNLNSKIKNISLIENIFVQEFNKDNVLIKIKYLGKLEKIKNRLKEENINLYQINDQWIITNI